jgi:AAA15 family ATPase/GTPase
MEFLERGRIDFMELENKRICIKQEKIELAKRKEERQRMKEEREIMTMDLETLPQVQQEYFRALQLEILAKRRIDN